MAAPLPNGNPVIFYTLTTAILTRNNLPQAHCHTGGSEAAPTRDRNQRKTGIDQNRGVEDQNHYNTAGRPAPILPEPAKRTVVIQGHADHNHFLPHKPA